MNIIQCTKPLLIFIVGPTSSGKTLVSIEVAIRLGCEIVSCDSMQVYKGMDILNRAPGRKDMKGIAHYLLRQVPVEKEYNAAEFIKDAKNAIKTIKSRDKTPLITGGTGLYVKALVDGLFAAPPADRKLREKLEEEAREKGNPHLYNKLENIDPATAAKLHPNDTRRIIRALEVYELTGRTIFDKKSESEGIDSGYNCVFFGLRLPREKLYENIDNTVDTMFEEGLVEEVRRLRTRDLSRTASKALGIAEISMFLDGGMDIDEARDLLKMNTRRYAKRQLTWFRADERIRWINADRNVTEIAEEIVAETNSQLAS